MASVTAVRVPAHLASPTALAAVDATLQRIVDLPLMEYEADVRRVITPTDSFEDIKGILAYPQLAALLTRAIWQDYSVKLADEAIARSDTPVVLTHGITDSGRLPTRDELSAAFDVPLPSPASVDRDDTVQRLVSNVTELYKTAECADSTVDLSLSELLQLVAGPLWSISPWLAVASHRRRFDILTAEYADATAGSSNCGPVLEVGGGSGLLAAALRERNIDVVCTDALSWTQTPGVEQHSYTKTAAAAVVKTTAEEAVATYKPGLVLCSWMPPGQDWTAAFRAHPSVRSYVLQGSPSVCGVLWQTYGQRVNALHAATTGGAVSSAGNDHSPDPPPFVADGFESRFAEDVSRFSLCHDDNPFRGIVGRSETHVFQRA